MGAPQGIYHTGSKDYLGDKATMLSSGWTQNNKTQSPWFERENKVHLF